jgi:hypothetical protein
MLICRTTYLAVIVWLALTVLPISFALADETITVQLASGRTFAGSVSARSDADRLWLQFGGLTARVLRPIDWSAVEAIRHQGQTIDQQRVLELARQMAPPPAAVDGGPPASGAIRNAPGEIDQASQAAAALDFQPPATHIDFYATLENWDADPQPDGLLLHLQLRDADGRAMPPQGSLQAELFAPVERRFQAVPHGRGASVLPLARWSHAVTPQDLRHGEAVIKLPFTAAGPVGTDLASPYGLLHVRLAVPGHGVFQDSYDGITLRRFTPTRDLLQRQGRQRTLFTEPPRRSGNLK